MEENQQNQFSDDSEDEIFFGEMSLKEAKRILSFNRYSIGCVHEKFKTDTDTSLKIIETHSSPDILCSSKTPDIYPLNTITTPSLSNPALSPQIDNDCNINPDDSFLMWEKIVSDMYDSPKKIQNLKISNKLIDKQEPKDPLTYIAVPEIIISENNGDKHINLEEQTAPKPAFKTPLKNDDAKTKLLCSTPQDESIPQDMFKTPCNELKASTFKTPANPSSRKIVALSPSKKYQNVVSPVATYVRNSPQVPLLKNVSLKKPLPGTSFLPKPIKYATQKVTGKNCNKENVKQENSKSVIHGNLKLPEVAYKAAKETKLVIIPDSTGLPQSRWAKQVASSIPRAMVIKHTHREISFTEKPLKHGQEDSFDNLPLDQADLSICTQKTTYSKPKKYM